MVNVETPEHASQMASLELFEQYRAAKAGDGRHDGHFVAAVRSTGIYCRPACPAPTPQQRNLEFMASTAAAQRSGYRACKRCRPDFVPAEGYARGDGLGARAVALIEAGAANLTSPEGLARRLRVSSEALSVAVTGRAGADVADVVIAIRARTARVLLESSDLSTRSIVAAAGFDSLAALEDTLQRVYAGTSTQLRCAAPRILMGAHPGVIRVELPVRRPFDFAGLLSYFRARRVAAIEDVGVEHYSRALSAPGGPVLATVFEIAERLFADLELTDPADLPCAVAALRRLFDLDADPAAVDVALGADPAIAPLVAARPGLRSPGAADGFEVAIRGIVGQQISVAAAATRLDALVATYGAAATNEDGLRSFPAPTALAQADPARLGMPRARGTTITTLARAVAEGTITLDGTSSVGDTKAALLEIAGIGPWTAGYIAMRLGDCDVLLNTDLGVLKSAAAHGVDITGGRDDLTPWRSYLTNHLWAAAH